MIVFKHKHTKNELKELMKYLHKLLQLCQQKCDNKLVENENKHVYYPLFSYNRDTKTETRTKGTKAI